VYTYCTSRVTWLVRARGPTAYLFGTYPVWISDSSIYPAFNGSTLSCHISLKLLYIVPGHHDNSNYRRGPDGTNVLWKRSKRSGNEFNNKHLHLRGQKLMKRLSTAICFKTNQVQWLCSSVQSWLILWLLIPLTYFDGWGTSAHSSDVGYFYGLKRRRIKVVKLCLSDERLLTALINDCTDAFVSTDNTGELDVRSRV
jgi:hypothetical protein